MIRALTWIFLALALAGAVALRGYREATAEPVVRTATFEAPGIAAPVRLLFLSDTHVQSPDMPPGRLGAILRRLDGLHPDLVLLGGDYTGDKLTGSRAIALSEAVAPFRFLHARFGIVAVLGNHDQSDAAAVRRAFSAIGVTVLTDSAQKFGPIAVGGIWHRPPKTFRQLLRLSGPKVVLSHRPDAIMNVPPQADLMLAGHTHCGQIVLPLVGPVFTGTTLPRKFVCGAARLGPTQLIVTAGLGTSHVPLRLGAPPDVWLIMLRPQRKGASRSAQAAN